jgi:hypothetical protein
MLFLFFSPKEKEQRMRETKKENKAFFSSFKGKQMAWRFCVI